MNSKRRYGYLIGIIMVFFSWSFIILGAEHTMIKVGLESIYKNAASVSLSSDTLMEIGYLDELGFMPIGTLESSEITVCKSNATFYELGGSYSTYQEAYEVAKSIGGIPVYVDLNLFKVYSTAPIGSIVLESVPTYLVTDSYGKELLLFQKGTIPLGFRGYDFSTGLNLTKVGTTKKYRGAIGIGGTTGITPYNLLPIEEYLYGVVPNEMAASWPAEALKAQAVAARSIAIYQYNRYIASGYNVVDTTATQAYGGYNKEDIRTTEAVDKTKGQTIRFAGKTAEALYFSTSGGYTESAENVWGYPIDYLVGVEDPFETEPAQGEWVRTITLEEINQCLADKKVDIGTAKGVQIISRTLSGRVNEMNIIGSTGIYSLTKENVRTFFSGTKEGSLKSRLFNLVGAVNSGSEQTPQMVSVLSASGVTDRAAQDLMVTNGQLTESILGESMTIESADGSFEMPFINGDSSGSTSVTETIMGDMTIVGKGYGHGVGMSQSGAKGMAKLGFNYDEILKYYYKGISVE